MEKIIIRWEKEVEKEVLSRIRMDIIKSIIASNAIDILIIDPKDKDYEEIIKEAHNNSDLILNEPIPEKLKEIAEEIAEEFNKTLELKNQKILDANIIIDETPWYNRFLKKWDKFAYQASKFNSKKKGNNKR